MTYANAHSMVKTKFHHQKCAVCRHTRRVAAWFKKEPVCQRCAARLVARRLEEVGSCKA